MSTTTDPAADPAAETAAERTARALDLIVRSRATAPAATWTEGASIAWELATPAFCAREAGEPLPDAAAVLAAGRDALAGFSELVGASRTAVAAVRWGEAAGRLRDALVFDYGELR